MTDDHLPTRQAIAAKDRSAPRKVTGRLRCAIEQMVWVGSRRSEAAKAAGLSDHGLREALKKAHVKAYYLAELGALRTSERAKTFHRLVELRDQDENKNAAVSAAKTMEQLDLEQARTGTPLSQVPGFVIQIINNTPPAAPGETPPRTAPAVIIDAHPIAIEQRADPKTEMSPLQGGNGGRS